MSDTLTLEDLVSNLRLYSRMKRELGAAGVDAHLEGARKELWKALDAIRSLPEDAALAEAEPDDLVSIRAARPEAARDLGEVSAADYRRRLAGAFLGRSAGCILGSVVEGWRVEAMEELARENGDDFPPTDYWTAVPEPAKLRYRTIRCDAYTRPLMKGIPVDDDLQYTALGLLILEDHGPDFTTHDVAAAWKRYLPFACTAEDIALTNIKNGVDAAIAGSTGGTPPPSRACYLSTEPDVPVPLDNPYLQWIGADIRSDPWGYVAPGRPEVAAELAYRDAVLSHRRNGIYGEMYFSAVIAAAFVVDDPMEALRLGLNEIPRSCSLATELRWALEVAPEIRSYRDAVAAVGERFAGMHWVHTINNACLTLWGVSIGGTDLSRVISETVAMGHDNDCTAATAGSIVGAVIGRDRIDDRWTRPFGNTMHSYLSGIDRFAIDDLLRRFEVQMQRLARI